MEGCINLKSLNLDELTGVVNLYPWFGNARKELCIRIAGMGDRDTASSALADASLYVSPKKVLADLRRIHPGPDCSDKDIDGILKSYITGDHDDGHPGKDTGRQIYVIGGDYFSQKQYDQIRTSEDGIFWKSDRNAGQERKPEDSRGDAGMPEFYTETLAQIYAEQGYPEQAKRIYNKLILAYPEKNAYFAALIRKLDQEIKN